MDLTVYDEVNRDESRKRHVLTLFLIQSHSFFRYVMQAKADTLCNKTHVREDFVIWNQQFKSKIFPFLVVLLGSTDSNHMPCTPPAYPFAFTTESIW